MNETNILFTSMGKAISSHIKYMSQVKIEEKVGVVKDITLCIATDQMILLDEDLKKYGIVKYPQLKLIKMDQHELSHRNNQKFLIKLNEKVILNDKKIFTIETPTPIPGSGINNNNEKNATLTATPNDENNSTEENQIQSVTTFKTDELIFRTEDRALLVKNILCYYSLYYLNKENDIKNLPTLINFFKNPNDKNNDKKHMPPPVFKFFEYNNFSFFLTHKIQHSINNRVFYITTIQTKKEFRIDLKIGEINDFNIFEVKKDLREISIYANNEAKEYLLEQKTSTDDYKIIKNSPFYKKFNFIEDKCQWEGWQIRARKCNLIKGIVKNIGFIYLRRKFLYPFYNTYQDICLIIQEDPKGQNKDFSPEAIETIELAANSLASIIKTPSDFKSILEAKLNGLLVDEEIILYYLNNLKIYEPEIIKIGYLFIYHIIQILKNKNQNQNAVADKSDKNIEWQNLLSNNWIRLNQNTDNEINKKKLSDM
jgi:hypothetical protein